MFAVAVFVASATDPAATEAESCIPLSWSCIPDTPVWSNAPFAASPTMSSANDFNIALGFPEDSAEIIATAPPTMAMFTLRPGANGGTMVVYFVIFSDTNFGPAPRRIPALSNPGIFGTAGKSNFGSVVLKLGRLDVPIDSGPPNAAETPEIEVGTLVAKVGELKDSCGDNTTGTEEKDGTFAPTATVLDTLGSDTAGALIFGTVASNDGIYFNHLRQQQTLCHS